MITSKYTMVINLHFPFFSQHFLEYIQFLILTFSRRKTKKGKLLCRWPLRKEILGLYIYIIINVSLLVLLVLLLLLRNHCASRTQEIIDYNVY